MHMNNRSTLSHSDRLIFVKWALTNNHPFILSITVHRDTIHEIEGKDKETHT